MTPLSAEARELIEEHLGLVQQVLTKVAAHYPRHADREELAQAARLGLVEAAVRYEAARGVPFAPWAALRVRGAIVDAVRALDFAPRTLRVAVRDLEVARADLEGELGRTPTNRELEERSGLTPMELVRLEGRLHRSLVLSLDAPMGEQDGQPTTLASSLVDSAHLEPLAALEEREVARYVGDAIACLPDRLKSVVVASYFEGESLGDIAQRLQVTESRVSQLRSEALALMRRGIEMQFEESHRQAGPPGAGTRRAVAFATSVAGRSTFRTRVSSRPSPAFAGRADLVRAVS